MDTRYQITYHTSNAFAANKPKRKHSHFDLLDLETNETKQFKFSKVLGEGSYGFVRLFVNGNDKIAVKAPIDDPDLRHLTKAQLKEKQDGVCGELSLLQQAYPNEYGYSPVTHYIERERDKKGFRYSWRMTSPFVAGMKLSDYAEKYITDVREMAELMLSVAKEMQRIHEEANVIHGDAGSRNIMVDPKHPEKIHFLDFGFAYPADGLAKVNYESNDSASDITSCDMAPERIPNRKLKARPVQDVYSLAKTLNKLIKRRDAEWKQTFNDQFPSVKNFIRNGILNWQKRPDLQTFIQHLESNLDWKANLPENMEEIANALDEEDFAEFKQLLKNAPEDYTPETLSPFLHNLIQSQAYDLALELMHHKKKIPIEKPIHGDNCLHLAASNSTIDIEFLRELLAYIPKKSLPAAVNTCNFSGDTALHSAATSGRADVVMELLKCSPDLLAKNNDSKLAAEIAHPLVEPVLSLFTYIAQLERDIKKLSGHRQFDNTAKKEQTNVLKAAKFLATQLSTQYETAGNDFSDYTDTIANSKKLHEIYQRLVKNNLIETDGSDTFSFSGMLAALRKYI